MTSTGDDILLDLAGLTKVYSVRGPGTLRRPKLPLSAVDAVDLAVPRGSSFGIAGESGSGKTTLTRMMLLLEEPTSGRMTFEGRDLTSLDRTGRLWYRRRVQAVFQDATSSLNPHMRVRDLVAEPLQVQAGAPPRTQVRARTIEVLGEVGLHAEMADSYPHELSGGQRQRVAIARALVVHPRLLVLDEPVSALDVSVRSQVLNLLMDLQEQQGLTYVMVSHDLALLRHVTTQLAVMYMGRIVERGETQKLIDDPVHPFTKGLLEASPRADPSRLRAAPAVMGEIGSAVNPPTGCRFHPRCPFAIDRCRTSVPALLERESGHFAACHVFNP